MGGEGAEFKRRNRLFLADRKKVNKLKNSNASQTGCGAIKIWSPTQIKENRAKRLGKYKIKPI